MRGISSLLEVAIEKKTIAAFLTLEAVDGPDLYAAGEVGAQTADLGVVRGRRQRHPARRWRQGTASLAEQEMTLAAAVPATTASAAESETTGSWAA